MLFSDLWDSVRLYFFLYTLLYFPKFNNRFILKSRVGVRGDYTHLKCEPKKKGRKGRRRGGRKKEQRCGERPRVRLLLRISSPGGHKQERRRMAAAGETDLNSWVTLQGPGEEFPLLTSISIPLGTGLGESNRKESGGRCAGGTKAMSVGSCCFVVFLLGTLPAPPLHLPPPIDLENGVPSTPSPPHTHTGHCFAFHGTQMTEPPQKIQRPNSPTVKLRTFMNPPLLASGTIEALGPHNAADCISMAQLVATFALRPREPPVCTAQAGKETSHSRASHLVYAFSSVFTRPWGGRSQMRKTEA